MNRVWQVHVDTMGATQTREVWSKRDCACKFERARQPPERIGEQT